MFKLLEKELSFDVTNCVRGCDEVAMFWKRRQIDNERKMKASGGNKLHRKFLIFPLEWDSNVVTCSLKPAESFNEAMHQIKDDWISYEKPISQGVKIDWDKSPRRLTSIRLSFPWHFEWKINRQARESSKLFTPWQQQQQLYVRDRNSWWFAVPYTLLICLSAKIIVVYANGGRRERQQSQKCKCLKRLANIFAIFIYLITSFCLYTHSAALLAFTMPSSCSNTINFRTSNLHIG